MNVLYVAFFALFVVVSLHTGNGAANNRRHPENTRSKLKISPVNNATEASANSSGICPEQEGFFPDPFQCDKYFVCKDDEVVEEKLCPDGMVFNDFSPIHEKCDLPFNIDCSQRPLRQEPKPTDHCPRMNGYFNHEDPHVCNKFYYCVDGKFNLITCPDGLVHSEKTGICAWPDEAKKRGCTSEELFNFTCPKVDTTFAAQHPRYPDPEDCQYFYVCINGEVPRRSGCKLGQVFNEKTSICDWPKYVPECTEWYKGVLTDEELEALEHPLPKIEPNLQTGIIRQKKTGKSKLSGHVTDLSSQMPH